MRQRIATQIEVLWHTDEVRSVRPRVLDEVGNALFYLERTFFDAIPDVQEQLGESIAHSSPTVTVPGASPIRLGSWVGSDQDGNPNADAATLTQTLGLQRRALLTRYRERVRALARDLSLSTRLTTIGPELAASIQKDEAELADYAASLNAGTVEEPYRRKLSFVWERLGATLESQAGAYASADQLRADLDLLDASPSRTAISCGFAGRSPPSASSARASMSDSIEPSSTPRRRRSSTASVRGPRSGALPR